MLKIIVCFFSLAILFGIYLLSFILQQKNTPKGVVFTHGMLAGTGLILLIVYAWAYSHALWWSVLIFTMAASGGFFMVLRDVTGKSVPVWLALGHGLIALSGLTLLIIYIFNY